MNIQKEQAISKGIELSVKYLNITETENVLAGDESLVEMFSPVIKSDVNRLQQVLLNL